MKSTETSGKKLKAPEPNALATKVLPVQVALDMHRRGLLTDMQLQAINAAAAKQLGFKVKT